MVVQSPPHHAHDLCIGLAGKREEGREGETGGRRGGGEGEEGKVRQEGEGEEERERRGGEGNNLLYIACMYSLEQIQNLLEQRFLTTSHQHTCPYICHVHCYTRTQARTHTYSTHTLYVISASSAMSVLGGPHGSLLVASRTLTSASVKLYTTFFLHRK